MDDSSSKPFFIALLAGGALLLAGIAIGVRLRTWRMSAVAQLWRGSATKTANRCTASVSRRIHEQIQDT